MKKKEKVSFSIFSETGKELIAIARKYCNFNFDENHRVTIGNVNYSFFVDTESDTIIVSKARKHEKVKTF